MIDFTNPEVIKLHESKDAYENLLDPMLCEDEFIISAFKSVRDGIAFTNKRIFVISYEGVTGKRKDITSLPYKNIQAFSVETAAVFDTDCSLELWFCGMGKLTFEFLGSKKAFEICRIISDYSL